MNIREVHALSFDIEEHFHVPAFDSPMRRRHWEHLESRVERNTREVLDLLAKKDIHGTFFVLGWVAERHPSLVREILHDGHEIASHGYAHELVLNQTPEQFRTDIRKARTILEDVTGKPVLGYRAPSCMMTPETRWSMQILAEEGCLYDSSVRHGAPHQIQTPAGSLWEIPSSVLSPRLYPLPVCRWLLKRFEARGRPIVLRCHPWELDPDQPRMNGPWLSKVCHYSGLHRMKARLEALLGDFAFAPIRECVEPVRHMYQRHVKDGRASRMGRPATGTHAGHAVCG